MRIGEDILSANLEKHRGMADPREGGLLSIGSQKGRVILGEGETVVPDTWIIRGVLHMSAPKVF
jgi:hypothetical protein